MLEGTLLIISIEQKNGREKKIWKSFIQSYINLKSWGYMMDINEEIYTCYENYQKWKSLALATTNEQESKKFMEKAFFWLELQSAFITLFAAEQIKGKDPVFKKKILLAKANLSKKLAEYAEKILNEIKGEKSD